MQTPDPGSEVLIVEDDPALREVFADVLVGEGYGVRLAANGREALAVLSAEPALPCAVLLDLRMPVMSGWELADRLRESDAWSRLPIVVVAAHYLVADEAHRIGAAAWLQKPVKLDRLVATVRDVCAEPQTRSAALS
jgi:two-component system response regulator (stage 0 sporulation protein F)